MPRFDRSDAEGFKAMRKAMEGSGIEPPDLDDFAWGEMMGVDEALARTAIEDTLETAIAEGDLVVGGRGWRARQQEITASVLDRDHPSRPASRSAHDHRHRADRRMGAVGRGALRAGRAPPSRHREQAAASVVAARRRRAAPCGGAVAARPLRRRAAPHPGRVPEPAVVVRVHEQRPWDDPYPTDRPPRTETDVMVLHRLRAWLQSVGALRKRGKVLRQTQPRRHDGDRRRRWHGRF